MNATDRYVPGGVGGWMSMRMRGRERLEEGARRNTLHPSIALNNEGLQGVWAICELRIRKVHDGKAQMLVLMKAFE